MLSKIETLKLIKSIGARGRKIDADIQQAAIASVFYSICYGDVTIGQKLVETLHSGARKAALVGFMEEFGHFEYKGKNVVYRKNSGEFKADDVTIVLADCLEDVEMCEAYCDGIKVHWTSFKPEAIKSKFDAADAVKNLVARLEKEIKAGNAKHAELYDGIAAVWNEFQEKQEELMLEEPEIPMLLTGTNG